MGTLRPPVGPVNRDGGMRPDPALALNPGFVNEMTNLTRGPRNIRRKRSRLTRLGNIVPIRSVRSARWRPIVQVVVVQSTLAGKYI